MNYHLKFVPLAVAATLVVGLLESASAQFFNNSTGIANPAETITFSEHALSQNTTMTTQYQDLGVTFQNAFYNPDPNTFGHDINPPDIGNFKQGVAASNPYSIFFTQAQTSAAFALGSQTGTTTFTALLNGNVVASGSASTSLPAGNANDFYGFNGVLFNQIRISTSSTDNASLVDNIQLAAAPSGSNALMVTPAGAALGFSLTTFASGFPTADTQDDGFGGPFGIAFPPSGGVLVSDAQGNVRKFATDTNGQTANSAPVGQNFGSFGALGMATLNGNIYMGGHNNGNVVQINPNGTLNQVIVNNVSGRGLVANRFTGRLFVSTVNQDTIFDVDPIAKTATPFLTNIDADGLSLSADGGILYVAVLGQRILGFDVNTKAQVFDSGLLPGVDGAVLGAGALSGELFANTHFGEVIEVDLANPNHKTVVASGGSRGDFLTIDPYNNSLLITQTDSIMRLKGGSFDTGNAEWQAGRDLAANELPDGNGVEQINPNPTVPEWSYGYRGSLTGTGLTLYTAAQHVNSDSGSTSVQGFSVSGTPQVFVNAGASDVIFDFGFGNLNPLHPGEMDLHPGPDANDIFSVVRWTAPRSGTFQFNAYWTDLDPNGTQFSGVNGATGAITLNGNVLFNVAFGNNSGTSTTFTQTVYTGDVVDFLNGSQGDYRFDDTGFDATINAVLTVQNVVSRKMHGGAGSFDVTLPFGSTPGLECRSGGATGDHQIIVTFSNSVTVNGNPQAGIVSGMGAIGTGGASNGGVVSINGNQVTIPLTNVANAQAIVLRLNSVNGTTTIDIPMRVLLGDTTGDGSVNSADIGQTKSKSGQVVDGTNFRNDVTADGTLNSADISLVKSKSGSGLTGQPTAPKIRERDPKSANSFSRRGQG